MRLALPFRSWEGFLLWLDLGIGRFLSHLGSAWIFLGLILLWSTVRFFKRKSVPKKQVVRQLENAGVDSLGIIAMVAFLVGVTLVLQSIYILDRYGQKDLVAAMVAITICRELGPLITAVIFTGRVGAAYTAELGTMKVSEEILALETMGINPIGFLVAPRFIAALIALPCLTIVADFVGMFGGYLVAMNFDIQSSTYLDVTRAFLRQRDFVFGIVKSFFFAVLVVNVACYKGFTVEGGGEEVGKATMEAVVITLVGIIFTDTVFTMLYNLMLRD